MNNKKYKILFFNNKKGSIKEIDFSKGLMLSFVLSIFFANFLIFNYLAEDYVIWKSDGKIQNHRENNKILVESINDSKDRISNIEHNPCEAINIDLNEINYEWKDKTL